MKRFTETATTKLVLDALRQSDDFMTARMLMRETGRGHGPVSGALHSLRKYRCVDVIVDPDGVGWWYARPECDDTRTKTADEHAPYPTGITHRRKKHAGS